ncbi:MAG: site-specific integrase [Halomonas sp.]
MTAAAPLPCLYASFITLGLHTGCRMSELLGLEWRRVSFQHALLTLEPDHDKAGKRRTVPLNDVAMAALKRRAAFVAKYCPGSPWVFAKRNGERLGTPRYAFTAACKAAGITNYRIHDMRHTCASWMVSEGVPLADVKEVLGHSTIAMTEKYAHLAPHRARDAVASLTSSTSEPSESSSQSRHNERPARVIEDLVGRKRRS